MEKFFIVTDSRLGEDYKAHKECVSKLDKIVDKFLESRGIEAKEYMIHPSSKLLGIKPTEKDLEKYENKLQKGYGDRYFKKNSKIQKDWLEEIKDFKLVKKPTPIFYIDASPFYGCRTRLFQIDKEVYCSIDMKIEFAGGEGFKEIKASEFYKVIEDYNAKVKEKAI